MSVEVDKSKYHNPHPQITLRRNHINEHDHFIKMIYDAPTVDAVEVVRCKDCKHCCFDLSGRDVHYCMNEKGGFIMRRKLDDFCSYGERKE